MTTLVIEKSKGGYRPFEPDKEERQRLTIKANGMVWFTTYGLKTGQMWEYKTMRKIRYRITPEQANAFISNAEKVIEQIKQCYDDFVADAEPDRLTIKTEDEVSIGVVMEEHSQDLVDLYNEIRKALPYDFLLEFEYGFLSE